MLRERLQGALGGVAQETRKVSAQSAASAQNFQQNSSTRPSWNSGASAGYNPTPEYFQPAAVPHLDQSQRGGSRPPVDPYDPYR